MTRKNIIYFLAGLILVLGVVYVVLQRMGYFEPEPQPVPPPAPVVKAPPPKSKNVAEIKVDPDKLIADVLVTSGTQDMLSHIPDQVITGFRRAQQQNGKPSAINPEEIEKLIRETLIVQNFQNQVTNELKKNYDQKRLEKFLADISTPLAKRMMALENVQPSEKEFVEFSSNLKTSPLSAERTKLLQQLDTESMASDFALEVTLSSLQAMMIGAAGQDTNKLTDVDKTVEQIRSNSAQNVRDATLHNFAYIYRGISDADLEAYTKIYHSPESKSFMDSVFRAVLTEFKNGSMQLGQRIGTLMKVNVTEEKPVMKPKHVRRSRIHEDARHCLDFETNIEIIRCAEKYR